jgi:hypothetical protein
VHALQRRERGGLREVHAHGGSGGAGGGGGGQEASEQQGGARRGHEHEDKQ